MRRQSLHTTRLIGFALTVMLGFASQAQAFVIFAPADTPLNPFDESLCPGGDAGDTFPAACLVTGGPYDGFTGDIGSDTGPFLAATDFTDIFAFHWITTAGFVTSYSGPEISLGLFYYPGASPVPGDNDPTSFGINITELPAGDYFLRLDALVDPPFSIQVFAPPLPPGNATNIGPIVQAPEPALLLLLGTGLATAVRRRWNRTS